MKSLILSSILVLASSQAFAEVRQLHCESLPRAEKILITTSLQDVETPDLTSANNTKIRGLEINKNQDSTLVLLEEPEDGDSSDAKSTFRNFSFNIGTKDVKSGGLEFDLFSIDLMLISPHLKLSEIKPGEEFIGLIRASSLAYHLDMAIPVSGRLACTLK